MKKITISILMVISTFAFSSEFSLNEFLEKQEKVTIRPVLYKAMPVGSRASLYLCGLLGFTHTVSYESKEEMIIQFFSLNAEGISAPKFDLIKNPRRRMTEVLKSLTCAK